MAIMVVDGLPLLPPGASGYAVSNAHVVPAVLPVSCIIDSGPPRPGSVGGAVGPVCRESANLARVDPGPAVYGFEHDCVIRNVPNVPARSTPCLQGSQPVPASPPPSRFTARQQP
jgi:hypothetical protein